MSLLLKYKGRLTPPLFLFAALLFCNSCTQDTDGATKNSANKNSENEELITSETFVFKSASGRLSNEYKFDLQIEYTLGLAIFKYDSYTDTCLFTSLTPEFIFYSHQRKDEFTWASTKTQYKWELHPLEDLVVVLEHVK